MPILPANIEGEMVIGSIEQIDVRVVGWSVRLSELKSAKITGGNRVDWTTRKRVQWVVLREGNELQEKQKCRPPVL